MLLFIGILSSSFANSKTVFHPLIFITSPENGMFVTVPVDNLPPPNNYPASISVLNTSCPYIYDDGSLTISGLPSSGYPYSIDLCIANGTLVNCGILLTTAYPVNVPSYTFSNLGVGKYYVTATASNGDTYQGGIEILEESNWPIHPLTTNGGKAEGMDVKTDKDGILYATGWFSNDFRILQNPTLTVAPYCAQDGYLAKLDPCGNLIWNVQLGSTGTCTPQALCLDASQNIIIVGTYTQNINFPNGPTLYQTGDAQGFVAKFDRSNGNCIWAAKFVSIGAKSVTAKDVTADDNDDIFILGDFFGIDLTFYNAANVPSTPTLNPSLADNFIAVYDANGFVKYYSNNPTSSNLSTVGNDKAGGLCCAANPSTTTSLTDIYLTGQRDNTDFLGQHYLWDHALSTMTWTTDYSISNPFLLPQEGNSVAIFDKTNGNRSISFAGTQTFLLSTPTNPRTYPFITHEDLILTPAYPIAQTLSQIKLVKDNPNKSNFSKDIAINSLTGEIFTGGGFNEPGAFIANAPINCTFISSTLNQVDGYDFFYFSFFESPLCPMVNKLCGIYSRTIGSNPPISGCNEIVSGICANSDQNSTNSSFITGSFSGTGMEIESNAATAMPNTKIAPNFTNGLDCYISRIFTYPYGTYHMKNDLQYSQANNNMATEEFYFYPNPASQTISIALMTGINSEATVQIKDITGHIVAELFHGDLNATPKTISIEEVSKGAYILEYYSKGKTVSKKLIIL